MSLLALVLLAEHDALNTPTIEQRENQLFRVLRMPNGTHKLTSPGRLTELDKRLLSFLPQGEAVSLLDIAASSGVTTCDLVRTLSEGGLDVFSVATDLYLHASIETYPLGVQCLVHKQTQRILEASGLGLHITDDKPTWLRPLAWCRHELVTALSVLRRRVAKANRMCKTRDDVLLATFWARQLVDEFYEHDMFGWTPEWEQRFSVVRAANILNDVYFSPTQCRAALKNLVRYVRPDGFLVLARSIDVRLEFSILQRVNGQFRVIDRGGRPSEVESIALEVATSSIR